MPMGRAAGGPGTASGYNGPMAELIYVNGELVPRAEARVSALDQGLLYGYGLFETMRAYEGRVFRLDDHLSRLIHSGEQVGILLGGEWQRLEAAVGRTLEANRLASARVRLTVTAGEAPDGRPGAPPRGRCGTIVRATPLEPTSVHDYERGYRVVLAGRPKHSLSTTGSMKTLNYLENLLALAEARRRGADEALFLNEKRCVAEATMANVFFVVRGRLLTPSHDCGLLRGITRGAVMALATKRGIALERAWVPLEEAFEASEVFLTSSGIELMPVTSLDGRQVGDGTPGEITRVLTRAYRDLVKRELRLG